MKPKPTKFRLLAVSLFIAVSLTVSAQDDAKAKQQAKEEAEKRATTELILGLPKISDKTLFIITETAQKINGLIYVNFCEGHKLAMFKYNKELFEKPEDVIKAFEHENVIMPMLIKQGNFNDVVDICPIK